MKEAFVREYIKARGGVGEMSVDEKETIVGMISEGRSQRTGKIIVLGDSSGQKTKVRIDPKLPEGVAHSVRNPGSYIVLARPGVAWPKLEAAAAFARRLKTNPQWKPTLDISKTGRS